VFEAAGGADRAAVAGRSCFDALPPGADRYVLKSLAEALARIATSVPRP
jgi:hypothetical protein